MLAGVHPATREVPTLVPEHRQKFIFGADGRLGPFPRLVEGAAAVFKSVQRALELRSRRVESDRESRGLPRVMERHPLIAARCQRVLLRP
jgi:hypothetical protein